MTICVSSLKTGFRLNGTIRGEPGSGVEKGGNIDDLEKALDDVKCLSQVCCFSNYGISNMPLWAHYANNYKGYCLEYSVIDKTPIYPITYVPKRYPVATIPTRLISGSWKSRDKNGEKSKDFEKYLIYFYMSFSCKDKYWEFENEFRFFNVEDNIEKGKLISFTKANLNIDKIYIGMNCEYQSELRKIGEALGCEVHKMFFAKYSQKFALQSKRII